MGPRAYGNAHLWDLVNQQKAVISRIVCLQERLLIMTA